MSKELSGVILAGGKSSRMGSDKGLLLIDGTRMVERIMRVLDPLVNDVLIISNTENYNYLGQSVYSDLINDCGPIGGIYTALRKSKTDYNIIVACDMPFLKVGVFNYLISQIGSNQIIVPRHKDQLEPLCAIYHKSCANGFLDQIQNRQLKLVEAIKSFDYKILEIDPIKYGEDCFYNINTSMEYQTLNISKSENSN